MLRKPFFWAILLLVLLIGGGAVSYYYNFQGFKTYVDTLRGAPSATSQAEKVATAPVTTGDLSIKVSGVGNILASKEVVLGFGTSGIVKTIAVQPGDEVQVGTVLATLDDTTARYNVVQAGAAVEQAQLQLSKLIDPTVDSVATARANLAAAESTLTALTQPTASSVAAARSNLVSAQQAYAKLVGPTDANTLASLQSDLQTAQVAVAKAQTAYNQVAWRNDVGTTTESANLQTATLAYEKAKAAYALATEAPTADTVSAARAKISSAQDTLNNLTNPDPNLIAADKAKVVSAQAALDDLLKGGVPQDIQLAQVAVQTAQNTLHSHMLDLDSTVITSPITGTVTTVNVTIGQQASNGSAITVDQFPEVRFWIDETDLSKIAVGDPVDITFSSYDTLTFTGKVVRIDPALVTVNNSPTVQVWATFDPKQHPAKLLYGMDADVEVVAGQATNALLVPVTALRQIGPGQYVVFAMQPNGELQMQPVKVGLKDAVNAQILDGVTAGEQVSISGSSTGQGGGQGGANRTGGQGAQGRANAGAGR